MTFETYLKKQPRERLNIAWPKGSNALYGEQRQNKCQVQVLSIKNSRVKNQIKTNKSSSQGNRMFFKN